MVCVVPELQLVSKLGNGHFGIVFLGEDSVHGRVAVKVLARKPNQSDASWQAEKTSFLAEAQHLRAAKHRNVVEVHHLSEAPDGESIRCCMALCPGGSLQSEFEAGPMLLLTVRKVATEVLMGLQALHNRGMLHRDIKPGNILIDAHGVAQIGDFGLVTDELVLGYGSQAGYADHVAIEVWLGGGSSIKTDIWALGMTLYRLLHGQIWYDAAPAPKESIKQGGFVDTLRWLPHIPKAWRRVIRKMMNDDSSLRFQSADQVLEALSDLPTPSWTVTIGPNQVRWEQLAVKRLKFVEWTRHSSRKHEWKAWSQPAEGAGRTLTLAGSNGTIGRAQLQRELEDFFEV